MKRRPAYRYLLGLGFRAAVAAIACLLSLSASAAEYTLNEFDAPPPDELQAEIVEKLSSKGFKVLSAQGRALCEVWPAKSWPAAANFKATGEVNYPFSVGELLGAIRFARNGGDFRGQKIRKGVYTLRYGLQPQDGNHVGTSDTRDFAVLLPAAEDKNASPLEKEKLFEASTKASGTPHPAVLSLLPNKAGAKNLLRMVHHEDADLWAVDFTGQLNGNEPFVVELVIIGHAGE